MCPLMGFRITGNEQSRTRRRRFLTINSLSHNDLATSKDAAWPLLIGK